MNNHIKKSYGFLALICLLWSSFLFSQPNPGGNSWGGDPGGDSLAGDQKKLNITCFLEGPWNNGEMKTELADQALLPLSQPFNVSPWNYSGTEFVSAMPPGVVDWVLVELRDAPSPEQALPSTTLAGWPRAMFILKNGSLRSMNGYRPLIGNPAVTHNLYIVIRHRNHIDVMSAAGMSYDGKTYTWNFSSSLATTFGGGAGYKEIVPGIFGMVAGDADADGAVFTSDFNAWSSGFGITSQYDSRDMDLDGQIFTSDFNRWSGNFGLDHPVENKTLPRFICQVPQ